VRRRTQPNARLGGHFGGNVGGENHCDHSNEISHTMRMLKISERTGGSRIPVSKSVVQRIPVDESNPHGMWGCKSGVFNIVNGTMR